MNFETWAKEKIIQRAAAMGFSFNLDDVKHVATEYGEMVWLQKATLPGRSAPEMLLGWKPHPPIQTGIKTIQTGSGWDVIATAYLPKDMKINCRFPELVFLLLPDGTVKGTDDAKPDHNN